MSRPVLFAVDENEQSLQAIEAELRDRYERAYRVVGGGGEEGLEHLELRSRADWLPAEILRDAGGFIRTGATLAGEPGREPARAPFSLETSVPGVFAVGDVRNGSMSRVAAAVGEGSVAVRLVHELFATERLRASTV